MSVALNYTEGYARFKVKVYKNFLEIAFGSLKETEYLIIFSFEEDYLSEEKYKLLQKMAREIGAMLLGILKNLKE